MGEQFSKALCAFPPIWAIDLPLQTLFVGPFVAPIRGAASTHFTLAAAADRRPHRDHQNSETVFTAATVLHQIQLPPRNRMSLRCRTTGRSLTLIQ